MYSAYPREPGIAGGKSDFEFSFIGPLEVGQGGLMPTKFKRDQVTCDLIEACIHEDEPVPVGRDVIFGLYQNGALIDTITIPDGTRDGTPVILDPAIVVEAGDKVTCKPLQVGNAVRGGTASVALRVAS